MMIFRNIRPVLFALATIVAFGASSARARTLMVLADWYGMASTDSLVRADSVWVPFYDGTYGSYLGKSNLKLVRTEAFATPIPVNLAKSAEFHLPTALVRNWYSLPGYVSTDFRGGLINFRFGYLSAIHSLKSQLDGSILVKIDTSHGIGLTSSLNLPSATGGNSLDRCIDSLGPTDTLWMRSNGQPSNTPSTFDCYNHNPFWLERGTIWFAPPFPVTRPEVELDGMRIPLRAKATFPGWYAAPRLDTSLVANPTVRLRFFAIGPDGQALKWDSAGAPWTVAIDSAKSVWMTPAGLASVQHPDPTKPVVWIGFSADGRLALEAGSKGFAGRDILAGWAGLPFWNRPTSVWLVHADGTRSKEIPIPPTGDSIWLDADAASGRPAAATIDSFPLLARAFDYDATYAPFAANGPDDNCVASGGGVTKGLVKDQLDSAGLPVWTGMVACDIGKAQDGPGNWFKPGHAVLDTTLSFPMKRSNIDGSWSYANPSFFPLDHASSNRNPGNNFAFCLHFEFETVAFPGASIAITGDDDLWLFADRKLALDLGGQHPPASGKVDLSRVAGTNGGIVAFDLFQCERHVTGSTLSISTNALLSRKGTLREPPEATTENVNHAAGSLSMRTSGRRLSIDRPVGTAWTLEVRGVDGRRILDRSGTGSAEFELPASRVVAVAKLRTAGTSESKTFFVR